jgi:hypothetical protein
MKTAIIIGIITIVGIGSGLGIHIHRTNVIFQDHISQGDQAYRNREYQKALVHNFVKKYTSDYTVNALPIYVHRKGLANVALKY